MINRGDNVMINIQRVIEVRSDQINADDIIPGKPIDVVLTGEIRTTTVNGVWQLEIETINSKLYRPSKGMATVLVRVLGEDELNWRGRVVRLFKDETVKFGGEKVGGVRISHVSGIKEVSGGHSMTFMSRGRAKKKFVVEEIYNLTAESFRKRMCEAVSVEELDGVASELKITIDKGCDLTGVEVASLKNVYLAVKKYLQENSDTNEVNDEDE